jgi:DNA-binding NtrC family response regulator
MQGTSMAQKAKRILIVDDDQSLFPLLERVLSDEQRILLRASTLTKAREILKSEPVDLLLLDLYLPDGSGINLLSDLKKNGEIAKQPRAIIMTAFGDWESHVKAYRLGVFYYLDKPFKVTQLRILVEQALSANGSGVTK